MSARPKASLNEASPHPQGCFSPPEAHQRDRRERSGLARAPSDCQRFRHCPRKLPARLCGSNSPNITTAAEITRGTSPRVGIEVQAGARRQHPHRYDVSPTPRKKPPVHDIADQLGTRSLARACVSLCVNMNNSESGPRAKSLPLWRRSQLNVPPFLIMQSPYHPKGP